MSLGDACTSRGHRSVRRNRPSVLILLVMSSLPILIAPARAEASLILCPSPRVGSNWTVEKDVLCWTSRYGQVLELSRDGGRTWRSIRSAGIPPSPGRLTDVVLSPGFPGDHTIYALYSEAGLLRSTDDGETFGLVDPLAKTNSIVRLTPAAGFDSTVPSAPGTTGSVVFGGGPGAVFNGITHQVIAASGNLVDRFFVRTRSDTWLDANEGNATAITGGSANGSGVNLCDVRLTCPTKVIAMPDIGANVIEIAADPALRGGVIVLAQNNYRQSFAWGSVDGGRTFKAIPGLQAAFATARQSPYTAITLSAAILPRGGWFVRLGYGAGSVLLSSQNVGRSWSTVKTSGLGSANTESSLESTPDGRLLATSDGAFACSSDNGRTWRRRC